VRCYRFFTGREGDRQPACDPLERVRSSDTKEHVMHHGRLGRRLLADIELYLAFFAIARAG